MQGIPQEALATNAWTVHRGAWTLRAWCLRIVSQWAQLRRKNPRRLRLAESLPLGERRFVAVIEFEEQRFLLGGTSSSLVLLAQLRKGRGISPADRNRAANQTDAGQP